MIESTMQEGSLTLTQIFRHGRLFADEAEVVSFDGKKSRRASFGQVAERAELLAAALKRLGIKRGDRVATLCWNNQEHVEAYLAVPCMGAVLHPLNLRLAPDQLAYVINHADDRVIIVDSSLVPILEKVKDKLKNVEHVIVIGKGDAGALGDVLRYEALLAKEKPGFDWPELEETTAAAMCYTTGTTGEPKGVVYSHRSIFLHSLAEWGAFSLKQGDRLLLIVPLFHVLSWGLPYTAWMIGGTLLLPGKFLQAEPLTRFMKAEKPTFAAGVPTIWSDVLLHLDEHPIDLSSLDLVICGGAAVPRSLMEEFEEKHGMRMIQAWGMTETSPIAAVAFPPKNAPPKKVMDWRAKTGRIVAGVELRIVDDKGKTLPSDGKAVGEIEVRGPWITASYYRERAPDKFNDGWLKTGDVGNVLPNGFIQITDRSKDVIKSGGEWISSVELEVVLMGHPAVVEAAVIGVPDPKWDERPLAAVVLKKGKSAKPDDLRAYLEDKVVKFWLPERWVFMEEIPKTSVGKSDKKVLRSMYKEGKLDTAELEPAGKKG
jgi:fatty-acyl-CoA synthase